MINDFLASNQLDKVIFKQPFQLSNKNKNKNNWICKLHTPIYIRDEGVQFLNSQPVAHGWVAHLKSSQVISKLKVIELMLQKQFIQIPTVSIHPQENVPEILKYHKQIRLTDLQHVWSSSITKDQTIKVYFNNPQQLGMCQFNKEDDKDDTDLVRYRKISLKINGIWCGEMGAGPIIQLDK